MRDVKHFKKRADHCIVALGEQFIDDYLDPSIDEVATPYRIETNPRLAADCNVCESDAAAEQLTADSRAKEQK